MLISEVGQHYPSIHPQVFVAVAKKLSKELNKTTDAQLASVLGRQRLHVWPSASGALLTLTTLDLWRGTADSGEPGDADRRTLFMDLWRQSAAVKLDAMNDYVRDLLENGQKFLLFAHHQFVMDSFSENLSKQVRAQRKTKIRTCMINAVCARNVAIVHAIGGHLCSHRR